MRACNVYQNGCLAGVIKELSPDHYIFQYDKEFLSDAAKSPISLTLPKREEPYESEVLFPFFFNMLSEGENRKFQSQYLHLDEHDDFGFLLETARYDTIGSVTVKPLTI